MTITLKEGFKTPTALVDWVEIRVSLKSKSHPGHIKRAYEQQGVSRATPLDVGDGGAASEFDIRIQHPRNYAAVETIVNDLDASYGFISSPKLIAIEVSIDFYHESADFSALMAMTERLMLSIAPPVANNPRVHGYSGGLFLSKDEINATRTLYIGNETDDLMWRVYWKRTDDTVEGLDGRRIAKPLPDSEFRARVEVRLQGKALGLFQIDMVSDLSNFAFEKLHTESLFKFARRDERVGALFTNDYSIYTAKSLGIDDESPAFVLNRFNRKDKRRRDIQLSRSLKTDIELTEASRNSLRRLTKRFSLKHPAL
ncbi:MAG: hypothetical protein WCZ98_04065 [Sideroxydans sp.]